MIKTAILIVMTVNSLYLPKSKVVREYPTFEECEKAIPDYANFVRNGEYVRCLDVYRKAGPDDPTQQ